MEINKIYCMDALEFLKGFPDNYADLILTDPPYGIGASKGAHSDKMAKIKRYEDEWDNKTPEKEIFQEILRVGKEVMIFGGNFFTDKIPVGTHWLVWDKKGDGNFKNNYSDAELIWTNIKRTNVKKYTVIQQGFIAEEKARLHPTQKPVALIMNILEDYTTPGQIIMDPFIGSGTTAVAAKKLGRNFIGCDILQKYTDISNKRLESQWI